MIKDKSLVTKSVLCTAFSDLWCEHFCFPGVAGLSAAPPHALRARSYNTAEFPNSCTMDSSHHYPSIDMEIRSCIMFGWLAHSLPGVSCFPFLFVYRHYWGVWVLQLYQLIVFSRNVITQEWSRKLRPILRLKLFLNRVVVSQ